MSEPHEAYRGIPVGRISLLPERERDPFLQYLCFKSRPLIDELPEQEQDYFFWWDYQRWSSQQKDN